MCVSCVSPFLSLQRDVIGIAASMIAMQGLTIVVFQVMHIGNALALFPAR